MGFGWAWVRGARGGGWGLDLGQIGGKSAAFFFGCAKILRVIGEKALYSAVEKKRAGFSYASWSKNLKRRTAERRKFWGLAGRDCTKSRISEGRLSAALAPLKAPKIRPCWLALPLISHCLPGRDVSTRACDPNCAGYMGLTSDRLELASGSGSQRAKMSKNTRFLDLWAAVGCPRRSEWSSGEPRLMGGLSRAPTLRRAQNLAHFGP